MENSSKLLLKFDGDDQLHIEAILAVWRCTRDLDPGVWRDAKSRCSQATIVRRLVILLLTFTL